MEVDNITIDEYYKNIEQLFFSIGTVDDKIRDFRYQFLVRYFPREKEVLDIGCNSGMWGNFFTQEKGCTVTGIDFPLVLDRNKEKYKFKTMPVNVNDLSVFSDERFDVVWLGEILIHNHDPLNVLAQCKRVLKKGGPIFISLPMEQIKSWSFQFQKNVDEYYAMIRSSFDVLDFLTFHQMEKTSGIIFYCIKNDEIKL